MIRRLLFGAAAAFALAGAAQAKPPVWIVRDADSEMVLFGSIHVLPPALDWTPPALERDLKAADDLWFELPIDDTTQTQVAELARARGLAPPGQALTKLLSPEGRARLARICESRRLPANALDAYEPWYAEVAVAWMMFHQAGAEAESGVEKQIAARAPARAMRRAFETPAQQIALFADTPLSDQVASLEQSLAEFDDDPDQMAQLVKDWLAGDLAGMDRDALEPLRKASPAIYRRLITERNARWVQALDGRLKGAGRTVVVVGMAHMIGPEGLPARLRGLGYSVEGP